MPREHLLEAFRLLNLPEDLILLLLTWHTETAYIIQWKGLEAEQATFRGIRQGCRGAPFFWPALLLWSLNMWHTRLMLTGCETTAHFMLMMVTLALFFRNLEELHRGLNFFGCLIDILERLGMTVNMSKSAAIMQWRGAFRTEATKAYVTKSQHETYLKIPKRQTSHYEIPLREHQDYLGISIGYKQMLRGTMKKRLKACTNRHRQMKTWFSNASLHVAQKLSLWETCVLPIALYGLDSVGVDHTTIPLFSKALLPQLRQVLREHSFLTHQECRFS